MNEFFARNQLGFVGYYVAILFSAAFTPDQQILRLVIIGLPVLSLFLFMVAAWQTSPSKQDSILISDHSCPSDPNLPCKVSIQRSNKWRFFRVSVFLFLFSLGVALVIPLWLTQQPLVAQNSEELAKDAASVSKAIDLLGVENEGHYIAYLGQIVGFYARHKDRYEKEFITSDRQLVEWQDFLKRKRETGGIFSSVLFPLGGIVRAGKNHLEGIAGSWTVAETSSRPRMTPSASWGLLAVVCGLFSIACVHLYRRYTLVSQKLQETDSIVTDLRIANGKLEQENSRLKTPADRADPSVKAAVWVALNEASRDSNGLERILEVGRGKIHAALNELLNEGKIESSSGFFRPKHS